MKSLIIAVILPLVVFMASASLAQTLIGPKNNIGYASVKGARGTSLGKVETDMKVPADLKLSFSDASSNTSNIDILFHSAVEAGWIFQLMQQISSSVTFNLSDGSGLKPPHKKTAGNESMTDVGNYTITIGGSQEITIIDQRYRSLKVTIPEGQNVDLDKFTDGIRDSLVTQCSFTKDSEGDLDHWKNIKRCAKKRSN